MWGTWGACDATCGAGSQRRQRACDWPAPQHGGAGCIGSTSEARSCSAPCPVERLPTDKMVVFSRTMPSKLPGCTLFHCGAAGLCSTCADTAVAGTTVGDALSKLLASTAAVEAGNAANRAQLQNARAELVRVKREAFLLGVNAEYPESWARGY